MNSKKHKSSKSKRPVRSKQVPATTSMLYEMEERVNHRMDAGFERLRGEMNSGFRDLKSEIHGVKSEIHEMKSEIHGIKSEMHRVALLVEEQNARNKYVMDGYAQLYELINSRNQR